MSAPQPSKTPRKFTLAEVEKWPIKMGHCLELEHGLMGNFPAIIKGQMEGKYPRPVLMFEKEPLISKVWPLMSKRESKLSSQTYYVSEELGVAFPVRMAEFMIEGAWPEPIPPVRFLTKEELDRIIAENPNPFEWAPGLIGPDMNADEFIETLRAAAAKHGVNLDEPEPELATA